MSDQTSVPNLKTALENPVVLRDLLLTLTDEDFEAADRMVENVERNMAMDACADQPDVMSEPKPVQEADSESEALGFLDSPLPHDIRNMRIFMRMDQKKLAVALGVSRWTVRSWELGKMRMRRDIAMHLRRLYDKTMGFKEIE